VNQMSPFGFHDAAQDPESLVEARPAQGFRIKRTGQRPLVFEGAELCMAMSFVPGTPSWYEINLYRTSAQGFVVAIRQFFKSEDERDRVRAWEFESFEAAVACLEGYDAGEDVRVERFPDEASGAADLAASAFSLRAQVEAARDQYAGLVGEILYELEGPG